MFFLEKNCYYYDINKKKPQEKEIVMKHKKILTVTLVVTIIAALTILMSLQSNIPTVAQSSAAIANPQAVPLSPGQSIPKAPGIDYTAEKILVTLSPTPSGCTLDQDTVEEMLTNINIMMTNAINIGNILYQQPLDLQAPNNNLQVILENSRMPQDTTMNCKVMRDNLAYLAKLITILSENIVYAIPSNAATIAR